MRYVYFNSCFYISFFIDLKITFHTNPYNLACSRLLWFWAPCDVSCCVRLQTLLLHFVGNCCAKFETSQTFKLRGNGRNNSQYLWADNGSENVTQRVNSRCYKLNRPYSNFFNLSNVDDFVIRWILKDCLKKKKKNHFVCVHVLHKTLRGFTS